MKKFCIINIDMYSLDKYVKHVVKLNILNMNTINLIVIAFLSLVK